MRSFQTFIVVCMLSIVLNACSNSQNTDRQQRVSETSSSTQTSLVIEGTQATQPATRNVDESTATVVPEAPAATTGPTPTLPMSTEREFALVDLLFQGTAECILPCWNEILPGKSTEHEVDNIIQSIFSIDLSDAAHYDFQILPSTSTDLAEQYYLKGYSWYSGSTNSDTVFHLDLAFDKSTQVLNLLGMRWSTGASSGLLLDLTPLDVIRHIGAPSFFGARPETSERTDYGSVRLLLVYAQGAVFQFSYVDMSFTTSPTEDPAVQNTHIELCLDTSISEPEANIGYMIGDVYLMEAFSSDLGDLAPIQASVITDLIDFYDYAPIDEVFGVSPQEIADRAANEDDVCLSTIIN